MHEEQGRPRYSIVVPAYNEAAYVGRALTSLQQQDFDGPYEIVVVDNNSTDDTAAVAAGYGVQVEHEPQQGVCAARQRGVDTSRGDIVVSVDADTIYPPNWLNTIDARFAESPDAVAVAGPCRYQNPAWWAKAYPELLFGLVALVFALTGIVLYVSATNIAVRRSAFPGYDLHLTQGGDELDLLRRLRRRGPVVWVRDNVVNTSARRIQRGLIYNVFVTFFVYYILGYLLNRLLAHRTIGMAPAFRQAVKVPHRSPWPRRRVMVVSLMVLGVTTLGLATYAGPEAFARVVDFWKSP
jgi:glycosyltransferase involved in cell wall biosynthesis